MKIKAKILGVAFAGMMAGTTANADVSPFTDCGIGAALFTNDTAAVISNVIWDLGTTAITSATASPETCEGANADAAAYIFESYDNLIEDTAKGDGEYLDTLLSIINVSEEEKSSVISAIRSNMASTVADEAYESATRVEKSSRYYDSLISAIQA